MTLFVAIGAEGGLFYFCFKTEFFWLAYKYTVSIKHTIHTGYKCYTINRVASFQAMISTLHYTLYTLQYEGQQTTEYE